MPAVSILLTCFNHLAYLPAAFESIRAQTFEDYEILALDDGSSDGTREWLCAQTEPKLERVFHERMGTYGSLDDGLERVDAEFVAILNDDDLWAPTKLATQIARMRAEPAIGLSHTSGWFIDAKGERHPESAPLGFPFPRMASRRPLADLIMKNQIITSSVVMRTDVVRRHGPFDADFYGCGDWQMWLRLAGHCEFDFVDEPSTFYRVHGTNAARDQGRMSDDSRRVREWIATWPEIPELRPALAHNWACLGTERSLRGDRRGGRAAYWQAVKRNPARLKTYLRLAATCLPTALFRRLS